MNDQKSKSRIITECYVQVDKDAEMQSQNHCLVSVIDREKNRSYRGMD